MYVITNTTYTDPRNPMKEMTTNLEISIGIERGSNTRKLYTAAQNIYPEYGPVPIIQGRAFESSGISP